MYRRRLRAAETSDAPWRAVLAPSRRSSATLPTLTLSAEARSGAAPNASPSPLLAPICCSPSANALSHRSAVRSQYSAPSVRCSVFQDNNTDSVGTAVAAITDRTLRRLALALSDLRFR